MFKFYLFKEKNNIQYSHYGIIDNETKTFLAISKNFQYMNYFRDFVLDSVFINIPTSSNNERKFIDDVIKNKKINSLRWNTNKRKIEKQIKTPPNIDKKALITQEKYFYLEKIIDGIIFLRNEYKKNIPYQETIYISKKIEALDFIEKKYPIEQICDYQYIQQYADFKKITYREAADAILLKSKIDDACLAKTELLRIKYFNKIKNANTVEMILEVYDEFLLDYYIKI